MCINHINHIERSSLGESNVWQKLGFLCLKSVPLFFFFFFSKEEHAWKKEKRKEYVHCRSN